MTTCPQCKMQVQQGIRFCPNCGALLQETAQPTATPASSIYSSSTEHTLFVSPPPPPMSTPASSIYSSSTEHTPLATPPSSPPSQKKGKNLPLICLSIGIIVGMLLSFLTFRIIYPNPSQTTTAGTNTRTSSSQTATSTSTTSATATSTPIDTATSTSTATATATVTTTPGQLLYKADFAKDKDIWTAASYQLDSSGKNLICDGKAACQAEPNFTPPTANYTVTITAQLGTDDNYNQGFCVEGRINSSDISVYLQSRVHKLIFRDGDCDRYLDPQGSVVLGHEPFTESITYNNDQVTIVISQSGNPFRFSTSTKNLSNGRTRITSSTAMTILGFEIDAV